MAAGDAVQAHLRHTVISNWQHGSHAHRQRCLRRKPPQGAGHKDQQGPARTLAGGIPCSNPGAAAPQELLSHSEGYPVCNELAYEPNERRLQNVFDSLQHNRDWGGWAGFALPRKGMWELVCTVAHHPRFFLWLERSLSCCGARYWKASFSATPLRAKALFPCFISNARDYKD